MASLQKDDLCTVLAVSSASAQLGNPVSLSAKTKKFIGSIVAANVDAATTITAFIEHSADKVNWFTFLTFTPIVGSSANAEIVRPAADTVLPYVRSKFTLTGVTKLADVAIKLFYENY